ADAPAAWDPARQDLRTATYGNSPELALHISAHYLANLLDSLDPDPIPTRFTVEVASNGGVYTPVNAADNFVDHDVTLPVSGPVSIGAVDQWRTGRLTMPMG